MAGRGTRLRSAQRWAVEPLRSEAGSEKQAGGLTATASSGEQPVGAAAGAGGGPPVAPAARGRCVPLPSSSPPLSSLFAINSRPHGAVNRGGPPHIACRGPAHARWCVLEWPSLLPGQAGGRPGLAPNRRCGLRWHVSRPNWINGSVAAAGRTRAGRKEGRRMGEGRGQASERSSHRLPTQSPLELELADSNGERSRTHGGHLVLS